MWGDEARPSESGIAYRRRGAGGASLVLLHGIPGSAASWEATTAQLSDDLDVIVPDLLGFGASARPMSLDELHVAAQAEALDRLLDELGVTSVTVVGHDFGGPVAVALSARRPEVVAALGLAATNVFTDTPIPFPLSTVNWPAVGSLSRRALFAPMALRMMLRQGVGAGCGPIDPAAHLGDRAQQQAISTIFAGSLTHLEALYGPVEAHLPHLEIPVFVGWGDHDPFFPLEQGERVARATHAELRIYPGAGHFLPHERPGELATDIASLMSRVRR
ncbi:MAG: alpha/beta hydrolase, partial [Actinomycetota bacterium]|nr:alpha/beta hydrolase [Actinomycetota bacterium]